MTSIRFGLKLSEHATIDELRDVWRVADEAGFDTCWVMDHFATVDERDDGYIFEAWALLAAMAEITSNVRIGCTVTGNTYRHPAVLAKTAVTVDHLSGGRLEFGIGAGWAEHEHTMLGLEFGTGRDRADRLDETMRVITSLWTAPRTTSAGRHYQLTDAVAEPKPLQRPYPPIWIGGSGRKRTLRTTAEYADVWNADIATPGAVAESSAVLDEHCVAVGRDPAAIRRSVQIPVADRIDAVLPTLEEFTRVGVTDFILLLRADEPVRQARQVAASLPRLRGLR